MIVDLEATTPQPLSEFQRRIQAFGDFLSIACSTRCAVEELVLEPQRVPDERRQRGTYHTAPIDERLDCASASAIVYGLLPRLPATRHRSALGGHPKPAIDGHLKTGHHT